MYSLIYIFMPFSLSIKYDKVNVSVKASKEAVKGGFGYAIVDTDDDVCPCSVKTDDMLRVTVING